MATQSDLRSMLHLIRGTTRRRGVRGEEQRLGKLIKRDQVRGGDCAVIAHALHRRPRSYSNELGRSFFIPSEAKSHHIIEENPDGFLPTSLRHTHTHTALCLVVIGVCIFLVVAAQITLYTTHVLQERLMLTDVFMASV